MVVPDSRLSGFLYIDFYFLNKFFKIKTIFQNEEEQNIIKQLKSIDFDKEVEWMKKFLASVESPVVFCHNDMQEGIFISYNKIIFISYNKIYYYDIQEQIFFLLFV